MRPAGGSTGMRFAGAASIPTAPALTPGGTATLSSDRLYRYALTRRWGDDPRYVLWVMLNPSSADADTDDPTIRRCRGLSAEHGYDALAVVNLFAVRSSNPARLAAYRDPVGPDNDAHIIRQAANAELVICAWGAMPLARARAREVLRLLADVDSEVGRVDLRCCGITRSGAPKHPLYLRAGTPFTPFAHASRRLR